MKLVEIKDVRVGQIWDNGNNFLIITGFSEYEPEMVHSVTYVPENKPITLKNGKKVTGLMYSSTSKNSLEGSKLIGKLGITHRIEDGKLVEIPRTAEFQIDDVVKFKWCDPRLYVINRKIDFGIKESHPNNACFEATNDLYGSCQLVDFELKRVGILGVTHEFVNDREAANE